MTIELFYKKNVLIDVRIDKEECDEFQIATIFDFIEDMQFNNDEPPTVIEYSIR